MEENNNNEKTILDKGKDEAKKQTKKFSSKIFRKILIKLLPFIGGFFLILLVAGLILAIPEIIKQTFNSLLGITDSISGTVKSQYSSDLLETAQQVHDEERDWVYYTDHELGLNSLESSVQLALTNNNESTSCATYVSCVLYASGHFTAEEINQFNFNFASEVDKLLNSNGWEKIEGKENLKAGDIIIGCESTGEISHVQIYVSENKLYTACDTYEIQGSAPKVTNENWISKYVTWWAYRQPSSGPTNPPAERELHNGELIHIDKNGAYKLNVKDLPEQILKELEDQKVNNEVMGFAQEVQLTDGTESTDTTEDQEVLKDMIQRYIEAEVKTTYPETKREGNEIDGIIKIKRASAITGEIDQILEYKSAKEFDEMLTNKDNNIYNCFSMDPDTLELWIARPGSSTMTYYFNGESKGERIEDEIVKDVIDYRKYVENYSTPLNFFLTLHLISQDVQFMEDFLDMVIGQKEKEIIVLTYLDSVSTTTVENNYSGMTKKTTTTINDDDFYQVQIDDEASGGSQESTQEDSNEINNENVHEHLSEIGYKKQITTTCSGQLLVTKLDTWLKSSNKEINQVPSNSEPKTEITVVKNENSAPVKVDATTKEQTHTKITKTTTTTTDINAYTIVDDESKINVEKFVNLIREYPKVENNFKTAPSNIFYLLQQDEKTQKHEKIMRYVLFELNEVDYGVTFVQLQYLLADEMDYFSSTDLLRDYIRYWEYPFTPQTNNDNTSYIIREDEDGNLVVGYGVDVNSYLYLFEENEYPTELGKEVPKEFVDSIEESKIEEVMDEIKVQLDGLELDLSGYQLNALVSRAFDFGEVGSLTSSGLSAGAIGRRNGKNFVQAYEEYWNPETDNLFKDKNNNANMDHLLYTTYMKAIDQNVPTTERRLMADWTLFQTGYYNILDRWHPNSDSILEACVVVMNELLNANVHYDLTGLPGKIDFESYEWSNYNCCCATYTSRVLYVSGVISADLFHELRGFHSSGSKHAPSADCTNGVGAILIAAGWKEVTEEQAQPGDVCIWHQVNGNGTGHVFIYAGENEVWDQRSGCVRIEEEQKGTRPAYGTQALWNHYKNSHDLCIYRMP